MEPPNEVLSVLGVVEVLDVLGMVDDVLALEDGDELVLEP